MIYTDMTRKAVRLAYDAHHGRLDDSGVPYIFHPFSVAESMETEEEAAVAIMHDVVEDTAVTLDDVVSAGFPATVTDALRLLTRDPEMPYFDYVARIRGNPIAVKVKLSDIADNSRADRLSSLPEERRRRLTDKYGKAVEMLTNPINTPNGIAR
ncbi:MAG: hypothetical protein LBS92_03450 [Candidatus Methanoplasma sp.]|jgi:(p)ppGpp synthase/HD superfamily hydrolase|nr:hypothetical protein [Candidatus Methanoplasma sp.]